MATAAKKEHYPVRSLVFKLFPISVLACVLVLAVVTGAPLPASATTPDPSCGLQYAGSIGGRANAIAVDGSTAYVGEETSFTILDIAGIPRSRVLGRVPLTTQVRDVEIVGTRAYLAAGAAGLIVVDIAAPTQPQILATLALSGDAHSVSIVGSRAYVATSDHGLVVVDVTTPTALAIIGGYGATIGTRGLEVAGSIAYLLADTRGTAGGVHIVDVGDPANPTLLSTTGSTSTGDSVDALAVSNALLYIVGTDGLEIFDTSRPATPQRLAAYATGRTSIAVAGTSAIVGGNSGQVYVVDVATPSAPHLVGSYTLPPANWHAHISGDRAFFAQGGFGLQLLDIGSPTAIQRLETGYILGEVWESRVAGSHAFVAAGYGGLQVLNLADPTQPQPVTRIQVGYRALAIAREGNRIYVAAIKAQGSAPYVVQIFDIADPTAPALLSTYETSRRVIQMAVQDDRLYLAGYPGMEIVDVPNPTAPVRLGAPDTTREIADIQVEGTLVYLATASGMMIIDASVPTAPTLIWQEVGFGASSIHIVDEVVYKVGNFGLEVFDLHNPAQPTL